MKKFNYKKIGLSVMTIFVAVGLVGCGKEVKEQSNQESQQREESDFEKIADGKYQEIDGYDDLDISSWHLYKNDEMKFEVMIPENWICETTSLISDETSEETKERVERMRLKEVMCFNESTKGDTRAERIEKGETYVQFSSFFLDYLEKNYSETVSGYLDGLKSLREKQPENKLYLTNVDERESIFVVEHKNKKPFGSIESSLYFEKEGGVERFVIQCAGEDSMCADFGKSFIETLKFSF